MKEKPNKLIRFRRFVVRNKAIRKVGIDTNLIFSWMQNEESFKEYKPKFYYKKNRLFINYKIFGELMGLLVGKNPDENISRIKETIFNFLRKNNISLLKKKFIDGKKLKETLCKLNMNFKDKINESDLKIIAIFYCFNIDCIFSADKKHFEAPCRFLNINYEKHFEIEVGSEQDVQRMLRNLYQKKYRKKKY